MGKPQLSKARREVLRGERVTGAAVLAGPLAALRAIDGLARRAAPGVARELARELRAQIAQGVGADGAPWPKTEDGRVPLQGAAKALEVSARGTVVLATLRGHHARHSVGAVRGGKVRSILPSLRVPALIVKAVQAELEREIARTLGGGA